MKNYGKIFKVLMLVLMVVSVAILVAGFVTGFEANDGKFVDILFYWTYAMLAIALFAIVVIGLAIGIKNNPKFLVKLGIGVVAVAAVCAIAYFLAPGNPAVGLITEQPAASTLKLTDTVLNLTYFAGVAAVLAIIAGEIVMAVRK
ncbi:MAG: hypothetical protein MJZ09_06340 [Bacteroidales bacterium]|nr:hypothetical protein [Bacteroidales bacterium]